MGIGDDLLIQHKMAIADISWYDESAKSHRLRLEFAVQSLNAAKKRKQAIEKRAKELGINLLQDE